MKNKALMKLIVDRPWLVRQVLLTDREAVFVRYLKTENGITSRSGGDEYLYKPAI